MRIAATVYLLAWTENFCGSETRSFYDDERQAERIIAHARRSSRSSMELRRSVWHIGGSKYIRLLVDMLFAFHEMPARYGTYVQRKRDLGCHTSWQPANVQRIANILAFASEKSPAPLPGGEPYTSGGSGSGVATWWRQTPNMFQFVCELPDQVSVKRDVSVNFRKHSISLKIAGTPVVEGELPHGIRADESDWFIENELAGFDNGPRYLVIDLCKAEPNIHWEEPVRADMQQAVQSDTDGLQENRVSLLTHPDNNFSIPQHLTDPPFLPEGNSYARGSLGGETAAWWRQTSTIFQVVCELPDKVSVKHDVNIDLRKQSMILTIAGAPVVEGRLPHGILVDDSDWFVEDELPGFDDGPRYLIVELRKAEPHVNWQQPVLADMQQTVPSEETGLQEHTNSNLLTNFDGNLKTPLQLPGSPNAIQHYLHPRFFEHPELLAEVRRELHSGGVAVLHSAFKRDLAEQIHAELDAHPESEWECKAELRNSSGYGYHQLRQMPPLTNSLLQIFGDPETKRFVESLSGRECGGNTVGSSSFYKAGDYLLPHSDYSGQRTVAFVWHLSKQWEAEWGGALHWIPTQTYLHADFNTLYLFSVTDKSSHEVTKVAPHATEKRLSFNGWWTSSSLPKSIQDVEAMASEEKLRHATQDQLHAFLDVLNRNKGAVNPQLMQTVLQVAQKLSGDG